MSKNIDTVEKILINMGAQICDRSETMLTALFLLRKVKIDSNREGVTCVVVDDEEVFYPCYYGFGDQCIISTKGCYTKVTISTQEAL